jgi:hypothetical protein
MTQIRNVFAAIPVLLFATSFTILDDWYLFDLKDFTIEFPKKPSGSNENLNTEIGKLRMEMYMYEASNDADDNLVYSLMTLEYPDSLINSSKIEILPTLFRNAIDGGVKNVQGKLLTEKTIEINGFPGREVKVDYQNGLAIMKMRFYLIHNKMVVLQTITETSKENNLDALKFHDSFKLKK